MNNETALSVIFDLMPKNYIIKSLWTSSLLLDFDFKYMSWEGEVSHKNSMDDN